MTKNTYTICRLAIVILLSGTISLSINLENYWLPLILTVTAVAALLQCKKEYAKKHVIADERDYKIAGDAARYSIYAFAWIGTIGTFALMAFSHKEGMLYLLSQYFAFSVCGLLLLNSVLFAYLNRRQDK